MRIGDLLEFIAAGCLIAAAVLATHLAWPGLCVAGVAFAYFGQCWASHPVPQVSLAWSQRHKDEMSS